MYVIVVGAGKVGEHLIKHLYEHKVEITLIEEDPETAKRISSETDILVINSSCVGTDVLDKVDMEKCDYFISVTGHDEVNLFACLAAKKKGAKQVISRISNRKNTSIFEHFGVNMVVMPEIAAAEQILDEVVRPTSKVIKEFKVKNLELREISITNGSSKIVGKTVGE